MYASLRTNLPREVMGFESFSFGRVFGGDTRRFCGHAEVRAYLGAFADHFGLRDVVRLNTEVTSAYPIVSESSSETGSTVALTCWGPKWRVTCAPTHPGKEATRRGEGEDAESQSEVFDAVVVCNGHYSEPRVPTFPGSEQWPGTQMHSHNYREPAPAFVGKNVVVLGAMASGEDLSREIATVAAKVHLAARGYTPPKELGDMGCASSDPGNRTRRGGIVELLPHCSGVRFEDGSVEEDVDIIMYATGYHYTFPFLHTRGVGGAFLHTRGVGGGNHREDGAGGANHRRDGSGASAMLAVSTDDNCVSPLYQHVFPPQLAPSLSFIGGVLGAGGLGVRAWGLGFRV